MCRVQCAATRVYCWPELNALLSFSFFLLPMLTLIPGALVVGIVMGLLGSGGSAISVPLLVYVIGHGAKVSIAESMVIVGLIGFFAAIPYSMAR